MIVINLYAGPGTGKTTTAAALFTYLKGRGAKVECVREVAKDFIYEGREVQLANQFLISAMQYSRLKDLERTGHDVAISDSPLLQNMIYAEKLPYRDALMRLVRQVNGEFDNFNVFIRRKKKYMALGRMQTEAEAMMLDKHIYRTATKFDMEIDGNSEGRSELCIRLDHLLTTKGIL